MQVLRGIDLVLIATVAYILWAITVCISLILAKRSPIATIGWMVSLLALPYVGALVYLFFGPRRLARKRQRYAQARRLVSRSAKRPLSDFNAFSSNSQFFGLVERPISPSAASSRLLISSSELVEVINCRNPRSSRSGTQSIR